MMTCFFYPLNCFQRAFSVLVLLCLSAFFAPQTAFAHPHSKPVKVIAGGVEVLSSLQTIPARRGKTSGLSLRVWRGNILQHSAPELLGGPEREAVVTARPIHRIYKINELIQRDKSVFGMAKAVTPKQITRSN